MNIKKLNYDAQIIVEQQRLKKLALAVVLDPVVFVLSVDKFKTRIPLEYTNVCAKDGKKKTNKFLKDLEKEYLYNKRQVDLDHSIWIDIIGIDIEDFKKHCEQYATPIKWNSKNFFPEIYLGLLEKIERIIFV